MVHCHQGGGTADDLVRSLMLSGSSPTGHEERRMESLLDAIFAPYVDTIGRDYPLPVVDHAERRLKALALYKAVKG